MKHIYNIKIRVMLWAVLGIVGFTTDAVVAQVDMGCSPTVADDCSGGSSGGDSGGSSWGSWGNTYDPGPSAADLADQQALADNELGIQAYNNRDWATAIAYFQRALQNRPGDAVMLQNLANAQTNMANQQAIEQAERDALERQRQNQVAANNMQQSIQDFAQTLNASPTSGGLDFDGRGTGSASSNSDSGGLDFTSSVTVPGNNGGLDFIASVPQPAKTDGGCKPSDNPMVVDACNVPSGLTKDLDTAIASAYANAPPGVSERITKGFQAVMTKDWNVARAWFQDALNRDPNNDDIKRMVALTDIPPLTGQPLSPVDNRNEPDTRQLQLPHPDDIYLLFPGEELASPTTDTTREQTTDVYIYNPAKGYKRVTREEAMMMEIFDDMFGLPHLKQIPINPNFP